ncbi:MAG: tetratricopeptide repeat protein [Sediminispirochaetaceae bacterium]
MSARRLMGEVMQNSGQIETLLTEAQNRMREGSFSKAEEQLEQALEIDFEHPEVLSSLKCCSFWKEREKRYRDIQEEFDRGEYLLKQWKAFQGFLSRFETPIEQEVYALRQWVFGSALNSYKKVLRSEEEPDEDILIRIGRCYKGIGDYDKALEFFESAGRKKKDEPLFLAELGDCYAFLGETKASKAFFREAFFIDPQRVELEFLESGLIVRLIERLLDMGYSKPEINEWIPVYGVLLGVFNVKRELRPLEYGKLKQSIYGLERQLHEEEPSEEETIYLVPRLLNRYFWLIDHYVNSHENRERVEEILKKIKKIDETVYEHYIN